MSIKFDIRGNNTDKVLNRSSRLISVVLMTLTVSEEINTLI